MQELKIKYSRPELANYQIDIIDAPERYTVTEASTKTGKTASHVIWIFEKALGLQVGQFCWWIAPVYAQAKIAFDRFRHTITNKEIYQANESTLTVKLITGSEIVFKSGEKPDNLYGEDVYYAVCDEYTRMREESWFALRSTLTATKGKCKFIGNVKGRKNWGYKLAVKAKDPQNTDYAHFKITAYDAVEAGILDAQEVEDAKGDLPDAVFKELYLAEPQEDGSNPFGVSHIRECVKPLSNNEAVCYGIDLAKKQDYTVIIGLDKDGAVCYFDRFQKSWKDTIGEIKATVKHTSAFIDSTGVGDAITENVQEDCPNVDGYQFTSPSKQKLMEGLAMSIQRGETSVLEGEHQDELEAFEYEFTRTGVRYSAPAGLHDDIVCAHALAVKAWRDPDRNFEYVII